MRARADRPIGSIILLALAACPGAQPPVRGPAPVAIAIDGASLRGIAGDGATLFTATTQGDRTTFAARRAAAQVWRIEVAGAGGALALGKGVLAAAISGTGMVADVELRGGPAAVVVALDPASGAVRWKLPIDASEWSLVSAIAAVGDGFVVGGAFAGTLRAKSRVVSSAGKTDGFIARVTAGGDVAWLVRVGGANVDAVHGVAAAGERIAIAGTFAPTAELFGEPLVSIDEQSPRSDVFVAELTGAGAHKWHHVFGGRLDDSVAGIAIDGKGRIAVATTAREALRINVADLVIEGPADGLLTYYTADGTAGPTLRLGGGGFDGLRAVVASGDHVVAGGFFNGPITIGREAIRSSGGDDAYVAAFDAGKVVRVWPITGPGREEIAALAPVPGGFVAGVAHTASASIDMQELPAPADPMTGVALVLRSIR